MIFEEEKSNLGKNEIKIEAHKINNNIKKKETLNINEDSLNNSNLFNRSSSSSNSQKDYLDKKRLRKIFSPKINKIKEHSFKNIVGNIIFKSNGKDKCIVDFFKPKNLINNFRDEENIKEKNKEIEELKKEIERYQEKIIQIEKIHKEKIDRVNNNLCKILKELENLKRNIKKKELNELELKIGKTSLMRTNRGQFIDFWEDGNEIINIKNKLKLISEEKKEITDKQSFSNNLNEQNTISLKLSLLSREENNLNTKLKELEIEKNIFLLEQKNFLDEEKCIFNKEKYPLLNNRYQILNLLGKGGYSEVYKAFDLQEQIYVACKIFSINSNWSNEVIENYLKHTFREISLHKKINCPQIIKQLNSFNIDNRSYCTVLEYCNGKDLSSFMKLNKNLSENEVKKIIYQILKGLEYLNDSKNKIIHYDLKPQNILFHNNEIKISDFGISKIIENDSNSNNIELTSQGIGTFYYLPPECFEMGNKTKINNKVDIWSLGIITYELIYGKKPIGEGFSQEKLFNLFSNSISTFIINFPEEPKISFDCKEFIKGCLQPKIELRMDVSEALSSKFIKQVCLIK